MGHVDRMTVKWPQVETARLNLRLVKPADAVPTALLVTPDVAANLSTWPSPLSAEQALAKIREAEQRAAERTALDCAIIDRSSGMLLGWVGLAATEDQNVRLGYWLGSEWRGRGLMKEAVGAFLPMAAAYLGVDCAVALVLETNLPSIAVLKSAGFARAGEEDFHFQTANERRICLKYIWRPRRK